MLSQPCVRTGPKSRGMNSRSESLDSRKDLSVFRDGLRKSSTSCLRSLGGIASLLCAKPTVSENRFPKNILQGWTGSFNGEGTSPVMVIFRRVGGGANLVSAMRKEAWKAMFIAWSIPGHGDQYRSAGQNHSFNVCWEANFRRRERVAARAGTRTCAGSWASQDLDSSSF